MSTSNKPELPPLGTEHVPVLSNDRFDEFVNTYEFVFVGFTHIMSPRWNHFKPIFEQIDEGVQKHGTQCAVVDIDKSYDLVQGLGIDGWNRGAPSVYLFQEGVGHRKMYRGALREKEITQYLHRQKSNQISNITQENLELFKAQKDVVVVGYTEKGDWRLYPLFYKLARSFHDDLLFGMAWETDPEFAAAEGITVPSIVVYKSFDNGKEVKWFSTDVDAISEFIQEAARPLIQEFLPELHDDLLREGTPLGYILTDGSPISAELTSVIKALARVHKSQIHFGTWDASQYAKAEMDQDLRLLSPSYPAFAIREPIKNHRYPLNNPSIPLQDALPDFISHFLKGDLHPSVKTAPVPIQTSPVIEVVATTFNEIVLDPKKDVFIEFETKWCGPCKAIFPVLEKLAELYQDDKRWEDKVVIAKMDAEANNVPGEELRMFPTFRLYPAKVDHEEERKVWQWGQGYDWEEYKEADRRVESLAKFIEESGTWMAALDLNGK